MRKFVMGIEATRECILKAGEKMDRLYLIPFFVRAAVLVLLFLAVACSISCVPVLAVPILLAYYLIAAVLGIYGSIHSCKHLLGIWFSGSFMVSLLGVAAVLKFLPSNMMNPLILYIAFVLFTTLSWNITALLADYDVAKMACSIVNTITTIAMLFVNICFYWCSNDFIQWLHKLSPQLTNLAGVFSVEEYIYGCNMLLFPLVTAGFIAALFVEGKQYILKRMDISEKVTGN